MIRGVLFDMGNTLITSLESDVIHRMILKEKGIDKTLKEIRKAMVKAEKEFRKRHDKKKLLAMELDDFYIEWDNEVYEQLKLKRKGLGKYAHERWFELAELRAYDDAVPVLNRLSAMGLRLGLVTNGYFEEAKEVLERVHHTYVKDAADRTHLDLKMFSVIVGRDTTMAEKPDPRPFLHAAGTLGLKPNEILFVGDSYQKDYIGAQGAGMVPVLLLRGRPIPPEASDDITTAETLDEVIKFIL
ncbi:MAG: HAD family hydrolase [Thermoplasmata archaeon]|nr:HAD family hydrolase [Thermoplasmata archaeon]